MKRKISYIAVQVTENGKNYAYAVKVAESDNLLSKLEIKGITAANLCGSRKEAEEIVVNDITMKGIRDTIYRSGSKAAAREALRKSPDIVDAMSDDQWKQVQSWIMQMG